MSTQEAPKRKQYPHAGHRERLRRRFYEHGLDGFQDYEALELLLFYAIPRQDVNPLAHALIDRFGSLGGVFGAEPEDLLRVPQVGPHVTELLRFIPTFAQQYLLALQQGQSLPFFRTQGLMDFLAGYARALTAPMLQLLQLDHRGDVAAIHAVPQPSQLPGRLVSIQAATSNRLVLLESTQTPYTPVALPPPTPSALLLQTRFPQVDYCLWSIPDQRFLSFQLSAPDTAEAPPLLDAGPENLCVY